jgi:hypothetical protein
VFLTALSSIIMAIFNFQKMEATLVSITGWLDKQNVAYAFNWILFDPKKEENSDICHNMNEPWQHYGKKKANHRKTNTISFHLHEVLSQIRQKVKWWFLETGGGEKEMKSCYLIRIKFQLHKRSSRDWLQKNVKVLNTTELHN